MKCEKCGYYNKSDNDTCVICGSPLNQSPVLKYKQKAKNQSRNDETFNTTQKLVIAICTIGILMLIASAVIPSDLDFSNMLGSDNNTQNDTPVELNDTQIKIDTQIQVNSAGFGGKDQIIVNAIVKDVNNYPVNGGTASITINNVKYSGNVENGNVNIPIPKPNEEKPKVTVVYEGNNEYNPSEITTTLEITRISTQIDVEYNNSTIAATLKTANNESIPDSTITVLYSDNTSVNKQTDSNGRITLDTNFDSRIKNIKLSYAGNHQYNPCEKIIEIENSKIDTKINAEFNEEEKTITLMLVDIDNHPIGDATLDITCNDTRSSEKTNSIGIVEIPVNEGVCRFVIKYPGNDTYNPSETTINTVIEGNNSTNVTENNTTNNTTNVTMDNSTNTTNNMTSNSSINTTMNTTENNTSNTTVNVTNDTTNATVNVTNDTSSTDKNNSDDTNLTKNDTNNKADNDAKINTTLKAEVVKENSTIVVNLKTDDNRVVSDEIVKINLGNGTEITRKTDSKGMIILDLDDFHDIDKMEFKFYGDEDYASSDDYIFLI